MGQRVEVPIETANFLTQRARILERRPDTITIELPDALAQVDEQGVKRLFRRFRWLWGRRWRPEDD